jgi:PAS domain S-box-containing protein
MAPLFISDVLLNCARVGVTVTTVYLLLRVKLASNAAAWGFLGIILSRTAIQSLEQAGYWHSHPVAEVWCKGAGALIAAVTAILWARAVPGIIALVASVRSSEKRRSELSEKNELIEQLLRGSADPIFAMDREGRFTAWNAALARMSGVEQNQALGRHALECLPDVDQIAVYYDRFQKTLTGTPLNIEESQFTHPLTGEQGWYEASWTPLRALSGEVTGALCIFRDITERKKREALLLEQQQQLVESAKLRALGEMAGGMAHEINTPVQTIVLKAYELRKLATGLGSGAPPFTAIGDKIYLTAMRIADIVQSLKTFSRESDVDPFETVELGQVIRETLNLCEARFRKHEIELEINLAREQLQIQCRPVQIVQVLINLLNNSFDAVQEREKRFVRIAATEHGSKVRLEVTDNGTGIPPEMVPRLMQPFATSKGVGRGTGLGLSISKGIVEAHGGELTLDSPVGLTSFSVWLPKSQP